MGTVPITENLVEYINMKFVETWCKYIFFYFPYFSVLFGGKAKEITSISDCACIVTIDSH